MKKNYFITLILTICFSMLSFAQTPTITMILDGTCSGGNPKMLEIYASGTVDFSLYTLEKQSNANTSWGSAQSLSDFGTVTDAFVYVTTAGSSTALATEFPSITSVLESDAINVNGDDRVRIILTSDSSVIDQYGVTDTDGTGSYWEHLDSYAKRVDGTTADGTFVEANWTFPGANTLDGLGVCNGGSDTFETLIGIGTYTAGSSAESLPWSDSFETADLSSWTLVSDAGDAQNIWQISSTDSTQGTIPSAASDGSEMMSYDDYNTSSGLSATITSPELDLTSATAPQLTFDYYDYSESDTVEVLVNGSVVYTTPSSTSGWEEITVDLTSYVGANATIGFRGTSIWGYSNPHVDNVMVAEAPTAISADWSVSVSGADATVSMTVNNFTVGAAGGGDDGHWHYTLDGGSTVMVYDTNDVVLTGLANGEHTLVAWLVDDNHAALSPAIEETITFSTFNGNYEGSYPYCSSFDADLDNWTAEAVSGDANWSSASANQNSSVTPLTGAGMAYMYDNSSEANLISPSMDLSAVSNPQVTFNHTQVEWAGDQDELRVWYKAASGDAWTELAAYTTEVASWTEVTLDLPNPSADYYIAFNGTAGYGRGMTIDDVCVDAAPVSNTVLADPTLGWLGYMNVFDLTAGAQGGYLWGSAWGVGDVATTLNTDTDYMTITLEPNYNAYADNPGDAYWQDGSVGAKWMEGSTYVESATDWNGGELTFTGYVHHHSLASDWTANVFIKALDPNAGYADALNGAYITALPTDGQFSVTVSAGELLAGYIVQAGFSVNGPNANPDNQAANGKVIISGNVDAPMSIDDVNVLDMRIYPNPVDGNFVTILSPVNGTKYIQVFDIMGRRVMDTSINGNTLDVSLINSGYYMIKVTINGQSKISKLVVR